MKKVNKRASKRLSVKDKNKISRKVREHHRKQRREAKKNPHKAAKKDPGIPNAWPFKQELLAQAEAAREEAKEEAERARVWRERQKQRKAAQLKAAPSARPARSEAEARAAATERALRSADVLLAVVDARDPPAGRCAELEARFLARSEGALVVVLAHAELVPPDTLSGWLRALRAAGVVGVPLGLGGGARGAAGEAGAARSARQQALRVPGAPELCALLGALAASADLAADAPLRALLAAAPGLDLGAISRALALQLKRRGAARGRVQLLEPALLLEPVRAGGPASLPARNPTAGVHLFGVRPSRREADLLELAHALLGRCLDRLAVQRHYNLPACADTPAFLRALAHHLQLPAPAEGGQADLALAALAFLEQCRLGRVRLCARAPPAPPPSKRGAQPSARVLEAAATVLNEEAMRALLDSLAEPEAAGADGSSAGAVLEIAPSVEGVETALFEKHAQGAGAAGDEMMDDDEDEAEEEEDDDEP